MSRTSISGLVAAVALAGWTASAMAQSGPTKAPGDDPKTQSSNPKTQTEQSGADPSMAEPDKSTAPPRFDADPPQAATPAPHNSTMGAASTDVPTPSVVTHILSPQDAAKYNAEAAADDAKPTLAHALALTDEQRQWIAERIGNAGAGAKPEFKPEVAALMPPSAKASVKDLPPEIAAKIPWLKPVQFAVAGNEILLVDPGNSFLVLDIVKR